ncbi:MAG: hypothetical protein QOH64_1660 [Acidimicrobiaceae bacterium]|jgi:hypothetical protein
MDLNTIPRTAVKLSLDGLRLPITALEKLAGQRDNESWPPAMVFESFEATAKQVLGSMLRDNALVDEGRVQQAKVSELRNAVELEVQADQKRAEADSELRARREQADQRRRHVEEQARQREQRIEADKRAAEQQARAEAAERAAAADKAAELRDKRVEATERKARLTRVNEETAAVTEQRRAVQATKKAATLGETLDKKKAERKGA